jgi:hypothetical protein
MRNRLALVILALVVGIMGATATVASAFSITITFDENGHGVFTNDTGFVAALPFAQVTDPGPGGLPNALTYDLLNPPGLVPGDVIILEPGGQLRSDVIRFNGSALNGQTGGSFVVYSDNLDGADALADIGFPTAFYTNVVTLTEVGPEGGPNGISYTPTAGQPGFVAGAGGPVTYVFTSDAAVPEPATIFLVGGGFAAAFIRRRGRRVAG